MKNEIFLMLIEGKYLNFIVAGKSIHKGKNNASCTIFDNMIDLRGSIAVFGTSLIQIPKIDANSNSSIFLRNMKNIRHPFSQQHGVDKTILKKKFNFGFDSCNFSKVDLPMFLPNRFHGWISLGLMEKIRWINTRNFLVPPRENTSKVFKRDI